MNMPDWWGNPLWRGKQFLLPTLGAVLSSSGALAYSSANLQVGINCFGVSLFCFRQYVMTKHFYHLTLLAKHCWGMTAICTASAGIDMAQQLSWWKIVEIGWYLLFGEHFSTVSGSSSCFQVIGLMAAGIWNQGAIGKGFLLLFWINGFSNIYSLDADRRAHVIHVFNWLVGCCFFLQ